METSILDSGGGSHHFPRVLLLPLAVGTEPLTPPPPPTPRFSIVGLACPHYTHKQTPLRSRVTYEGFGAWDAWTSLPHLDAGAHRDVTGGGLFVEPAAAVWARNERRVRCRHDRWRQRRARFDSFRDFPGSPHRLSERLALLLPLRSGQNGKWVENGGSVLSLPQKVSRCEGVRTFGTAPPPPTGSASAALPRPPPP